MKTTMQINLVKTMKTNIQKLRNWKPTLAGLTIGMIALTAATGAGKPPKGPTDIPLRVTIEPYGVMESDGLGEYSNGESGVRAVFTAGQGRFSFNTGTRRTADIDLDGGLNPGKYPINFLVSRDEQDPRVNDPGYDDAHWHDLHLDQLPIGESMPVGLLFFIAPKRGSHWVVGLGDYPMATDVNHWPCGEASPAVVTRIDLNTWTLEADTADDHCLYRGFDFLDSVAFPFRMTMRRK